MSEFVPNSAIFRALVRSLSTSVSAAFDQVADRMAELLMKSTIVELGAYDHPRAAPLLDAGAGPADPSAMPTGRPWLFARLTG